MQILDRRIGQQRLDAARHYPTQACVDTVRVALRVPTLPGLGFGALHVDDPPALRAPLPASEAAQVHARSLVNRFVVVTLESSGAVTLFDRRTGERWLDLLRLESRGDAGDTYTYCPPARDRVTRSRGPVRVRRLAAGPLVAALEARWTMRLPRRRWVNVRHIVTLHADSPVIRCLLEVDNQATDHRLRARLPTGIRSTAIAGAAFGVTRRGPAIASQPRYPHETPARTAPAQRFVAVSQGDRGLALLAPGFFEYEYEPGGDLLFTILRAVGQLSRNDLPTRPGHAGWPTPTPGAQCLGPTRVELALAPLRERDLARGGGDLLIALWEHAFAPIRGMWVPDALRGEIRLPPVDVTLEGAGLVLSSVAPAADGLVLRCYNVTEHPASGAWRFGEPVRVARRTRLDGEAGVPLILEEGGRRVRFTAGPGDIVTVLVQ
jgi:alpha-mannosidase